MEQQYIYYIYKITCIISNRYYIGMHRTTNENDGYFGSGNLLKRSVAKYGKENHIKEILEYCDSKEQLCEREAEIVNANLLKDELCLNMMTGGMGGATMTGRKRSLEAIEKTRKANTGKIRSEQYRKENAIRMSKIWKGNQYAKGSKAWVGKKHREDSKILMRDNHPFVKKVEMYTQDGVLINEFNSLHEAEKLTGILRKHISRCCRGLAKTAGKHVWKFKII